VLIKLNLTFKRLANDKVLESCRAGGDTCLEALTELCECQVLSPEIYNPGVSSLKECEGQNSCDRKGEITRRLAGSEALSEHTQDNLRENREILCFTNGKKPKVRIANPRGVRR
jgi:hypothetical protein